MQYVNEKNIPFSMPGHKGGRGFLCTDEGRLLYDIMLKGDITEVEGLDNLHNPQGIIAESEQLLQNLYGSSKSYFLVNGSTSGNLAMIFSSFKEGDKVLVERNCHRSIFNAIIMRKLQPIYIKNYISKKYNAPISIDMEHFLQTLDSEQNIRGIVLTYPNYYGITCDLEFIVKVCKEREVKVLIDCAHGAHFGISPLLPENPIKLGADMAVMSAHKTLPSLTQTAYLHLGEGVDKNKVDFYVSAFSSTSPSYIFMAAMDYARFYLEGYGEEGFEDTIKLLGIYRDKINQLKGFHALEQEDIKTEYKNYNVNFDMSRLIINIDKGYNGHSILDYLRASGVQCEMSDGYNLVLIASPFHKEYEYEILYNALKRCPLDEFLTNNIDVKINDIPKRVLLPWEVEGKKSELIDITECIGKVSASNIVPYPPGVPLIMMGEVIDEDAVDMVQYYLNNGVTVLGIQEQKIRILNFGNGENK